MVELKPCPKCGVVKPRRESCLQCGYAEQSVSLSVRLSPEDMHALREALARDLHPNIRSVSDVIRSLIREKL